MTCCGGKFGSPLMIETTCRRPWGSARRASIEAAQVAGEMGGLAGAHASAQLHWERRRARPPSHSSSRGRRNACRGTGGRRRRTGAPGAQEATTRDRSPRTGAAQKAGRHLLASPTRSRPMGGRRGNRSTISVSSSCLRSAASSPSTNGLEPFSSRMLRLPGSHRRIRATRVEPPGPGSTASVRTRRIAIAVAATASAPARTIADSLRALVGLVRWTSPFGTDWAGVRR